MKLLFYSTENLLIKLSAFRLYVSTGTVLLQFVIKYEACKSMVKVQQQIFVENMINCHMPNLALQKLQFRLNKGYGLAKATVSLKIRVIVV